MSPASRGAASLAVCTTFGSASIRANTRSAAASPSWNWLQNDAMPMIGHQKKPTACMNRYQLPVEMFDGGRVARPPK